MNMGTMPFAISLKHSIAGLWNVDFTVENNGTTIACHKFEMTSTGDAGIFAPLVCVHGACVDSTFFDGVARGLCRHRRVVTYDRRGSGESSVAADDRYDIAAQAADLAAVIARVGAPCDILAHSAGTLVTMELLRNHPDLVGRVLLHEPAVTGEGVGLGSDPKLVALVEAGKASRALMGFLTALGEGDPRAPRSSEAEARHMMRDGRTFMAHEYVGIMDYAPVWDDVSAAHRVVGVGLGDLSLETPRAAGARFAAERLGCPVVAFPGAHNGLRDLPREAAWIVNGLLGA